MLIIEYNDKGIAYADSIVEQEATKAYDLYKNLADWASVTDASMCVSTENIITAFKMLIVEGKISYKDVQFRFEGQILETNELGEIITYPKGFCDSELNRLFRIMEAKRAMSRNKKG